MTIIDERARPQHFGGLVLVAALCAALALSAAVGAGTAEAKTYPAAEKKIEAAMSKGRTWVDFGSARIPWPEAYKAFKRVSCKKAGYLVKAHSCQVWCMTSKTYASGMKVRYRNAKQRKALNAKANAMLKKVNRWDSQSEKVEKIHDAIVKRARYDYTSYYSSKLREDSGSAYGNLVRGRSVCAGYAEAFQLVALKAGLQSRYVCNGSHAWNLVRVGGKWYHIDVCWDDTGGGKRKYFLKGSKTIAKYKYHAVKDCYPSKVSISKKDYVEPAPPVEVIEIVAPDTSGSDQGGLIAGGVKDPSKGISAGPNDDSGPGEYTGGSNAPVGGGAPDGT